MLQPLDDASVDEAARAIEAGGYTSVAVALLHSYADPEHERQGCRGIRRRLPGAAVTASSDVSPRFREYERTSTAVANAYVKPTVGDYLDRIQSLLEQNGYRAPLSIMQSNGGLVTPALARQHPVRIIESGPAAGVLMCAEIGREHGLQHLLTFDMGGHDREARRDRRRAAGHSPSFEVDTVRSEGQRPAAQHLGDRPAGDRRRRWQHRARRHGPDQGGPASAGAEPGPCAMAAAAREPTVTDANVVLGYIDPDNFNGGAITLNRAKPPRVSSASLRASGARCSVARPGASTRS